VRADSPDTSGGDKGTTKVASACGAPLLARMLAKVASGNPFLNQDGSGMVCLTHLFHLQGAKHGHMRLHQNISSASREQYLCAHWPWAKFARMQRQTRIHDPFWEPKSPNISDLQGQTN